MRRIFCLLLAAIMLFTLCGCMETPSTPTTVPEVKYPMISGTFMQPWAFADYDQAQMKQHLQYLKDVGIDLLIIQSTFAVNEQSSELTDKDLAFLDVVFAAAKELGMQVYVGLANDGNWWKKLFTDQQWLDDHVKASMQGAKTIYDTYKERYDATLTGWYFWPEYWNMDLDAEHTARAAKFLSEYRDGLHAIDNTMPMLLSPYITKAVDDKKTEKFWTDVLSASTLREGDIFCCQDSIGAGHVALEQLDGYFQAMKTAVSAKQGLAFWANNEDFTPDFKSADMDRFLQQLEITHKYADKHISFSFCHYRNPDMGKTAAYDAYKHYYQTGKLADGEPSVPEMTVEALNQGFYVEIDISVDNSNGDVHRIVITKDGVVIDEHIFGSNEAELQYHFTDVNSNQPLCQKFYAVYSVDYSGNVSKEAVESVTVFTMGM